MSKTASYRGINYTITKGPSLQRRWLTRPVWHGVFSFRGVEEHVECDTKYETVGAVEQAINIHLDYSGERPGQDMAPQLREHLLRSTVTMAEKPTKVMESDASVYM